MSVRFSVLVPVYNREAYVRQAIESVLSQTFANFELFAIDDGSTDGSANILKSFGDRIRFLQQSNHGPEAARNAAAALAQGEYLVFLDSDDFLFPYALETYDRVLRELNDPPLILGAEVFFKDGRYFREHEQFAPESFAPGPVKILTYRDYISKTVDTPATNSRMVLKKSVFDEVGGFRKDTTGLTFHNDDMYIALKVGSYGPCVIMKSPNTVAYRIHETNSIKGLKLIADGLIALADAERRGEFPGGRERRQQRYAVIGGRSSSWAYRYCWRQGQYGTALQLLARTAPMVLAAVWGKVKRRFHERPNPAPLVKSTSMPLPTGAAEARE
jgi:glycosyltransferase involved in cell wall biosynthesis